MRRLLFAIMCCSVLLTPAPALAQSPDAFTFSSFEADYYLSRDDDGRAQLRVVERLTAEFPEHDQNKGLVRELPRYYDGHTVSLSLESVTRNGVAEPIYDEYSRGDSRVIETGTDDYLPGQQTYEFTYSMRDVILDVGTHQEFYWNTNGTGWRQPFESLTARVHLDDSVRGAYAGRIRCIAGAYGESEQCAAAQDGDVLTFESERPLAPGENVTVVAMFQPGTFEPYDQGPVGVAARSSIIAAVIAALGALGFVTHLRLTRGRGASRSGPVSPQYAPPHGISLIEAAAVQGANSRTIPAQIIDLAVRGNLRIIEKEKKGLLSSGTEYDVELVHTDGLNSYESALVEALFPGLAPGSRHSFADSNSGVTRRLNELQKQARADAIEFGYRDRVRAGWPVFVVAALAIVVAGVAAIVVGNQPADWRYALVAVAVVAALSAIIAAIDIRPLTAKGRALVDHLDGIKKYIEMSEKERITATQSPGNAPTVQVSAFSPDQSVHLYESLLPYAVLFGQEKKWVGELSSRYEQEGHHFYPVWYYGTQPFSAQSFSSSMGSFVSSPGGPSSSSGFSGGGVSGGGGGGGGGGGR